MQEQALAFYADYHNGVIPFKEPEGYYKRYMKRKGFDGMVTFTGYMLIAKKYFNDVPLIAHEWMHMKQQQKEGRIMFAIKYTWHNLVKGYDTNPYEVEARAFQQYIQELENE